MREGLPDPGVPLLEEVRDGRAQAVHTGHAVLLEADGSVARAWGDPAFQAYWRSSAKPLQAQPFLDTGAFDALGLGAAELAIACASHAAEPEHLAAARRILDAAGVAEDELACGAHEGWGPVPAGGWSAIHNNCSGKHAAMLAAARRNGWPTAGYLDPGHPLQRAIQAVVGEATGEPVAWGTDGCSAPCFWSSLAGMARAYQWLRRRPGGRRALDAMAAHPHLVAGTGLFDTALIGATRGRVVGKVGAAGLHVAIDRSTGQAFAVKMASGARDARDQAAAHLARDAGWLGGEAEEALRPFLRPRLRTWSGKDVGTVRSLL